MDESQIFAAAVQLATPAERSAYLDAACAGAYFHGLAGDLAAAELGPAGMTAGDVIDRIPYALAQAVRH